MTQPIITQVTQTVVLSDFEVPMETYNIHVCRLLVSNATFIFIRRLSPRVKEDRDRRLRLGQVTVSY